MLAKLKASVLDGYRYREVLYNILSQDLKVKYRRTFFGYIWSLLNPVLQLAVLAAVFSHIVRLGIKDYTLFLFSGLLAWTFFNQSLLLSSPAILENENFIKKIYLPKYLFPLSKLCLRAIDFLFSLLALTLIAWLCGFTFHWTLVLLPGAIFSIFLFTLGIALVTSVTTVYFRDIQYLLSVALQLLYFATPILYPTSSLPAQYQPFIQLNPIYGQIRLFQELIYYGQVPTMVEWAVAYGTSLLSFACGMLTLVWLDEDLVFRM